MIELSSLGKVAGAFVNASQCRLYVRVVRRYLGQILVHLGCLGVIFGNAEMTGLDQVLLA